MLRRSSTSAPPGDRHPAPLGLSIAALALAACSVGTPDAAFSASDGSAGGSGGQAPDDPDNDPDNDPDDEPSDGGDDHGDPPSDDLPEPGSGTFEILDELGTLPRGDAANEAFCAQAYSPHANDRVRQTFCGPNGFPKVSSLAELLQVLQIDTDFSAESEFNLALSAHSTSVSTRTVSSINPRVFIYSRLNEQDELEDDDFFPRRGIVVSYTRGEPYIEIMAKHDRGEAAEPRNWVNFYLIKFDKACEADESCTPADFYTDAYEEDWQQISLYEDEVLRDTTLDCLACHQPPTASGAKIMLFPEDRNDFVHWFNPAEGGFNQQPDRYYDTFESFLGEGNDYGVIPAAEFRNADPDGLWSLMYRSGSLMQQPVEFPPSAIRNEVEDFGYSETWLGLYDAFVRGDTPPPPHYSAFADDPERVESLRIAYQDFHAGTLDASETPDLRAAIDPDKQREMGLGVSLGLSGAEILVNACAQCHRASNAEGSVRSRFLVDDLSTLSEAAKEIAIDRLRLPDDDPRKMPPVRFRSLSESEVDAAVEMLTP